VVLDEAAYKVSMQWHQNKSVQLVEARGSDEEHAPGPVIIDGKVDLLRRAKFHSDMLKIVNQVYDSPLHLGCVLRRTKGSNGGVEHVLELTEGAHDYPRDAKPINVYEKGHELIAAENEAMKDPRHWQSPRRC